MAASTSELPKALGRYRILRLIGQGAMGRVLLAYDPVLDREVAVKHLRDDLKIPPEVREGLAVRMRHEARAAARVMHPHLVTLHDMGEDPDLGLYLVFEYVEGPTLKQRVLEGRLEPEQGARLARELGAAMTIAHSAGIVHRDIKPENIILSRSGGKIADFGIARIPDSTLTHAGGLMGTPAYSAPETFQAGAFSPESDQFSLAASIYEGLSGKRAFPGEDAIAVASRIASEPPTRFAEALGLPAAVDEALARAMAKRPEDRFPSCEAFGEALESSVKRGPPPRVEIEAPVVPEDVMPPREPKTGHILLGAAVVVVTAVLLTRAVTKSAAGPSDDPAARDGSAAAASAQAQAASSGSARPRVTPPVSSRPQRPKPGDTEAQTSVEPTATSGPSTSASGSASAELRDGGVEAGASSAQPPGDAGATSTAPAPTPSSTPAEAPKKVDGGSP